MSVVFNADGTGKIDVDSVRWKAEGKTVKLTYPDGEVEKAAFELKGQTLVLKLPDGTVRLRRGKGAAKSKKPEGKGFWAKLAEAAAQQSAEGQPPASAPKGGGGGGDLERLLLSSAWCSFSYNKVSGYSHTSRVVFSSDGSWSSGSGSEGYSSGSGGTMASQSSGGDGGRWQARGGELYMSSSESPSLEPVGLQVTRNSNGSPILKADGKEYSSCR